MQSHRRNGLNDEINPKFGVPSKGEDWKSTSEPYAYPNVYEVQKTTEPERVALAPASDFVGLLRELAGVLSGPFGILYVLTLSRLGEAKPGRYQSPYPMEGVVLHSFLEDYGSFFEGDARHSVWVFSLGDKSQLVYDRHNIIFAYGPLDRFVEVAEARGLRRGEIKMPSPHTHAYNAAYDAEERCILSHWDWTWFPLMPQDED
jgi:hypothetical protein